MFIFLMAWPLAAGCTASPSATTAPAGQGAVASAGGAPPSPATPTTLAALLDGRPVTWDQLRAPMVEAAGGTVLAEIVLDRRVAERLAEHGIQLTDAQLHAERAILTEALSTNPDQAQRLLTALRQRRGWGPVRFADLLARNAGLRLLVQDQVTVNPAAVDEAYQIEYGPKLELRLMVVSTLPDAADFLRRVGGGESFAELAAAGSRDESRDRGGLLSPLSLADATYPAALRAAAGTLAVGQVSDPIALDQGYAILKLDRKIAAGGVRFEDVKSALTVRVRRRIEQMLMRRLARELVEQADVTVLDPQLDAGWAQQRKQLFPQP